MFSTNFVRAALLVLNFTGTACSTITKTEIGSDSIAVAPKPVTKHEIDTVIVEHKHYKIYFAPKYRLPRMVEYSLTDEKVKKIFIKRKGSEKFTQDVKLAQLGRAQAHPKEYVKTGYDKGHMAPAGDFAWDHEAYDSTYYMSNMAPQKGPFNQRAWRLLESRVQRYACGEKQITVYTGPILREGLPTLKSGLPIPQNFFKVVVDQTPPKKIIAFIYNQDDVRDVYKEREVPVDEVEEKTGLRFGVEDVPVRAPSSLADWKEEDCLSSAYKPLDLDGACGVGGVGCIAWPDYSVRIRCDVATNETDVIGSSYHRLCACNN